MMCLTGKEVERGEAIEAVNLYILPVYMRNSFCKSFKHYTVRVATIGLSEYEPGSGP